MTSGPIHVLLIEDNPGDVRLLRELLGNTGASTFILTQVDRLTDGIGHLKERVIDIILLDLSLPDSQGTETLLNTHAAAQGVPMW